MKKNIFKRLIALILAIVCIACFSTIAYAVAATIYSNIELEVVATIENKTYGGIKYTAVGGMAVGTNRTSMFVVKAEYHNEDEGIYAEEQMALFYDYPNISNPSNRHIYLLPQAGHANGMAIDDSNIYVCGWAYHGEGIGNQASNKENNWIIKLPRNKFSSFRDQADGYVIPKDNPNTTAVEGYSVLIPLVEGTDKVFGEKITAITKYNSNKSFIVEYLMSGVGNNLAYTTASLVTVGGVEKFYVSEDPDDIFIVQNNVQYADGTRQDICYSPGNGLFIPIWYGKEGSTYTNPNKNVIMWVDLSTSNNPKLSTITIGGKTYRYYTNPDKINVNQSNNGYTKFEVESIAIADSDEMLFSANVSGSNGELATKDSVFEMTHDGGQNFVLP